MNQQATKTPEGVQVGDQLPPLTVHITRSMLVQYAGASGDFNTIHWSDRAASSAGLPGVISHGMLTMAQAIRIVTDWAGSPEAVERYQTRFSRPVVVPDDDEGAEIAISAVVSAVLGDGLVEVSIEALNANQSVLAHATAAVRLTS